MRACPRCNNTAVIEDGYCGVCRECTMPSVAQGSLAAPSGSASVLELGHSKSNDAHCLACGFEMVRGRYVGLCPKCGSNRWYRTRLKQ